MATQISILGPIGGLYGRDIEQEIMCTQCHLISMFKFDHSIIIAKYALKASVMTSDFEKEDSMKESGIV